MARSTIDYGIDLGTTNSCIAVIEGIDTQVIRTNENQETTPSAVAINKKQSLHVGQKAKDQTISQDENERADIAMEFKSYMGHSEPYITFASNGQEMTAEDLSAEVLKKLRGDVQRNRDEQIVSAVISVPAAFELPQCSATDRAAKLAGLSFCPLVQEPVAASLAYGFQIKSDRVFWMVYDFGGGTFDAAIMRVRDEQIQVVNHKGDNHLGGKNIDWAIVNQLLVPAVQKEISIPFDDPKWNNIRPVLKYYAEKSKILLSEEEKTGEEIWQLFLNNQGASVSYEYEIYRKAIEPLMEPFIERSINICNEVLEEARLTSNDIEKLILVGGPTKTPLFREMLKEKIGIDLETKVDPMTVVARGAATFAATQVIPESSCQHVPLIAGQFKLELDYKPVGDETDPTIGGEVSSPDIESLQGYTIEFVEKAWRSGKLELGQNGSFVTTIHAERERRNEYKIELRDARGNLCETVPDQFTYTIGITIAGQPLLHDISIALANNQRHVVLMKNTALPISKRSVLHTTTYVKAGDSGNILKIPVVEGGNSFADRNPLVGYLEINGENIRRDILIGSDVEVTINMDESRLITVSAYIPIIDEDFEIKFNSEYPKLDEREQAAYAEQAKQRFERIREQATQAGSLEAITVITNIEKENSIQELDTSLLANRQGDKSALARCQQRRIDIDAKLDRIEEQMKWPALVAEAESTIREGREIIQHYGDAQDKSDFARLAAETNKAIASNDPDFLQQRIRHLSELTMQVLMKQPGFWVGRLELLEEKYKVDMRDQAEAEHLIVQGHRAISNGDMGSLKDDVYRLYKLLPEQLAEEVRAYGSTVGKRDS